jgi:hypothetical protein
LDRALAVGRAALTDLFAVNHILAGRSVLTMLVAGIVPRKREYPGSTHAAHYTPGLG